MILSKIKDCVNECNKVLGFKPVGYTFIPLAVDVHGPRKTKAVYGKDFIISMDTYYNGGALKDRDVFFEVGPIVIDILNTVIEKGGYANSLYVTTNGVVYDNEF